jgi:thiamine pyrophosphate-dependent acetolactate synthase large subunit-like protein
MWEEVDESEAPITVELGSIVATAETIERAAGLLLNAKRPVVLAGRGAIEARQELIELADRLGAPLMTSLGGRDLFRGHPADRGVLGTLSTAAGIDTISGADCVIVFGATLNRFTTERGDLLRGKTVIVCTTTPTELGGELSAYDVIHADAARTAASLSELLGLAEADPSGYSRSAPETATSDSHDTEIERMLAVLGAELPANRILVTDGGRFLAHTWKAIDVESPRLSVTSVSYGSIGLGIGHAIGAAVAEPDRPTILVVGDGGLMLSGVSELNTAVRCGLDLTVIVMNDGGYGAEYIQFEGRGMDPEISLMNWPDFAAVAQAFGVQGHTVTTVSQLESALGEPTTGPRLIDIRLDPADIPYLYR